jgi:hypothetical protein
MSEFFMNYKKPLPTTFYPSLGSSYTDNTNMAAWIYNFEKNNSELDTYEIQKNQLIKELVNQPLNILITVNEYTKNDYGYYVFSINQLLNQNSISFSILNGSYVSDPSGNIDASGNEISNNTDDLLVTVEYLPEESVLQVIPLGADTESLIVANIINVNAKEYLSNNHYTYVLGFKTNNTPT